MESVVNVLQRFFFFSNAIFHIELRLGQRYHTGSLFNIPFYRCRTDKTIFAFSQFKQPQLFPKDIYDKPAPFDCSSFLCKLIAESICFIAFYTFHQQNQLNSEFAENQLIYAVETIVNANCFIGYSYPSIAKYFEKEKICSDYEM